MRQRPDHYTIRAGRNLPDKEFRYLRTVIVTAAVYRGFNSGLRLAADSSSEPSGTGQVSGCILHLSILHSPVFLLNSCLDLFYAPRVNEDPLSRSYGVSLPNSLTMNLPSALVYSTRLRVSVYGTGGNVLKFSGFSRQFGYPHYQSTRRSHVLSGSTQEVDLPASIYIYTL